MKVTYLQHSGFCVEWEDCCFLFDWIGGELPRAAQEKPLYVFVSHGHGDHLHEDLFRQLAAKPDTVFLPANHCHLNEKKLAAMGATAEQKQRIRKMVANNSYTIPAPNGQEIDITTLLSTDEGVAFLVRYAGKTVYHAGDLNDWQWEGEAPEWNPKMRADYLHEMKKLKGVHIDLAMVPLDPRQEHNALWGINELLQFTTPKHILPMHLWDDYTMGRKWKEQWAPEGPADLLTEVEYRGQEFVF